ncbi:MAG: VTT domain-containing protein [Gammaproteobacteria bacterium]|nr:VTT domain-containing protein [Gammaproteobacteria bacterium]
MDINITHWVGSLGYYGLFLIVFLEMGFFFAFFLPGDSLALTAGIMAHKGIFHVWILCAVFVVSAVLGYMFGYWFGERLGGWLMKRKDSIWFRKQYIIRAHDFYNKHGGKAVMLGRMVPVVRTFVPIVAGMAKMEYRRFTLYNILGSIIWGVGFTLLGYFMGSFVPNITKIFLPIVCGIIVLSLLPGVIHVWKERRAEKLKSKAENKAKTE